ncbi:MAG: TetR/AcrR family transcriptional regulator [Actinomycetota bacterium]
MTSKRGRPRAGERAEREQRVLQAASDELIEQGYERVTMLAIARRAGASKETLYSWFENKSGLFSALITANADSSAEQIEHALAGGADVAEALIAYASGLLKLLTSPTSIALNRAAMSSPELAELLLQQGRYRVGPIVERYLGQLAGEGELSIPDPAAAFELLYGLVVQDTQIKVLLGERAPDGAALHARAESAVDAFLQLTAR